MPSVAFPWRLAAPVSSRGYKWVNPDVFPLVVILSGATTFATLFGMRALYASPDVMLDKTAREAGLADGDAYIEKGTKFQDHAVRRFFHGKSAEVFPRLNDRFAPIEHDLKAEVMWEHPVGHNPGGSKNN